LFLSLKVKKLDNRLALLNIFDSLPDLLKLAWERHEAFGDEVYATQDALREEHRRKQIAFKWSMPYRSLFFCPLCRYSNTVIQHELENPRIKDLSSPLLLVGISAEKVHAIREHGENFPGDVAAFLLEAGKALKPE
jgi:hypothetical protein